MILLDHVASITMFQEFATAMDIKSHHAMAAAILDCAGWR